MEYEKIKQLMEDMGNSKLTSLDIEFPDGIKIKMEKKEKEVLIQNISNDNVEAKVVNVPSQEAKEETKVEEKEDYNIIKSPMIGTFYTKPSPDSAPYVEQGSNVKKGDIVCIIEAMKLMNEIESEFNGKIIEVLVKDGETVDYGKPLFKVSK